MILLTVVDKRGGMLFNHRRQSQDSALREDILKLAEGKKLWMNGYSAKQFPDDKGISVDEAFLEKAKEQDYCFVEDQHCAPFEDRLKSVILYHWNREYPGDFFFDLDLKDGKWKLAETENFAGSSHEEITREVFRRVS